MDIGNEKKNKATNQSAGLRSKQPGQWRAVCGADQRFYFVNLKTKVSQWLPPTELWSSKFGLPYGWEAGLSNNSLKYYINHVNQNSTLEDPRSGADQVSTHLQMAATRARKIQIKRDPSVGFGFVAGSEKPVVIRSVISGGPSHGKLFSNDQIIKVNGQEVSEVSQERVISLIKSCIGELEIHVVSSEDLQDAKNQGPRRSSLMSRATRERRRSSPVNVRFADDMIQYIGPAEQARRSSLPVIPNVLKVYLENGQTRSFPYNPKTTVQEIFNALGPKLDIKAMEYFCLVLSGPQKNQLSFLQNHEKVCKIYLNRNCSRSSWVCKLRICFIPRDPDELLEKDSVAFDYFFDQISRDIVEGLFEIDLRYDLAIKLAALHMQQKATEAKHKIPTKISVKSVEKDFDGLQLFIPSNIINGVKLKDLRKVLEQQIKFNQSLAGLGQRYLTSKECKQQYLKLASELVSYGGKYFNVILYSNDGGTGSGGNTNTRKARQQEATVLVSPKYGFSRMVKGKINVLCQLAELEQISDFSISFHAEGKRLLTISANDNKDLVLLMKPMDSMDLVTFIVSYQKLWNCTAGKLTIIGEKKEPLAPMTDLDIPPYATLHRVFPDTWSYPSFLQVPGSSYDHHFYLDLSKDPPKYTSSNVEPTSGLAGENSSLDVHSSHIAAKRSSEDINTTESVEDEGVSSESVSGKRLKVDNSMYSYEQEKYSSLEGENDTEMADSSSKARTLYSIAEEGQNSNAQDKEPVEDDYTSQLALAEEIWRSNRNERIEMPLDESSTDSGSESQVTGDTMVDANPEEIKNVEDCNKEFEKHIGNDEDVEQGRMMDSDDDDDDDDDDVERNSSDEEEKFRPNDKYFSKQDHVKLDSLEQKRSAELLDINDIDFDDDCRASTNESIDLLADFSFTGEINPQENDSLSDIKEDNSQQDDDDVNGDEETLDLPTNETESNNPEILDDSTNVDSNDKTLKDCESQNISPSNEEDYQNYLDNDEVDEVGVHLLSYKQREDQDILVLYPGGVKDFDEELSGDNNSMDSDNYLGRKDSDSSSLTSKDSWHVVNAVSSESSCQEDSKAFGKEEQNNNSYLKANRRSSSSDEVDSLNELDTNIGSKGRPTEENKIFVSQTYLKEVRGRLEDALPGRTDQDDDTVDSTNNFISVEHEENDFKDTKMDENAIGVTSKDSENIEGKSSNSMVLFLGKDPGESEDTLNKFNNENSFEKNTDNISKNDLMDFQEFSLMDWIIPPPPGSTEELLDSDISVASPPPSCSSFDSISSPPVELNDNIFNEFEIDGMILPPPPMGSSLSSVIRIVSPPPLLAKGSYKKEVPTPTVKSDVKPINHIESNRQQLDKLTLEDSRNVTGEEFVPMNLAQSRSSESSGSILTDDYNSGSISCYSLSNDSQMTSEDEFFDEERHEIFREFDDRSSENVALFNLLEPGIPSKVLEEVSINSYETTKTQQGKTDEFSSKAVNDEIRAVAQEEGSLNNGQTESFEQIPLRDNSVMEILRNGLLHDGDYDSLDEVPFTVEKQSSINEGMDSKPRLAGLNQNSTVSLPFPNNVNLFIDEKDGPLKAVSTTFDNSNVEQASTSGEEHVKNRTNWFGSQRKPVRTNQIKALNSPEFSSRIKENGSRNKHILNARKHDNTISLNIRTLNENNPKPSLRISERVSSHKESISKKQSSSDDVIVPGYLLNESNGKLSEEAETKLPVSKWSLEFESEDEKDQNQRRFQRKAQAKKAENENTSTQNYYKDVVRTVGNGISSEESGRMDGAGAIDKNDVSENNVEIRLHDESSVDIKTSRLSVQAETVDLTERLKLRLQGCVDDCQDSILKSSYLPYVTSNKWKEGVYDNAELLASQIKLLNKNAQEMNDEVKQTIKASQEALQSLVSSFVLASTSQQKISLYSVRMLAGILNDVIYLHNDVIIKVEEAVRIYPNKSKLKSVAEKTTTMTALIASLRRTLKRL